MASTDPKHILIVEDSPDLQALLARFFQAEGYTLSLANNGRQALDLLGSMTTLPSLILLDLMMPVMDGVEFRREQRRDPRLAAIPVVVMTADANSHTRAADMDAAEVVRKPIADLDELLATIDRHRR